MHLPQLLFLQLTPRRKVIGTNPRRSGKASPELSHASLPLGANRIAHQRRCPTPDPQGHELLSLLAWHRRRPNLLLVLFLDDEAV